MKVIILAAGIGKRLGKSSDDGPKCLLEIDGSSLLERHVVQLKQLGLEDVNIVVGYQQERMVKELDRLGLAGKFFYNPDFRLGSIVSLYCAREILSSGEDVVLMDADVLYAPQILEALIKTEYSNCFLLDRDFEPGEEPVKLCVRDGQLIDFRKKIDKDLHYDFQGESVGFFCFSAAMANKLVKRLQQYVDEEHLDEPYEEAIRDLLLEHPDAFSYEDISGLPWIEIDFPEDLIRARTEILSKIEALEN